MSPAEAWDLIAPHAAGAAGAIVAASQAASLPAFLRALFAGVACAEFGGTWLVSWAKTSETFRAMATASESALAAHFVLGWAAEPLMNAARGILGAKAKAASGEGDSKNG